MRALSLIAILLLAVASGANAQPAQPARAPVVETSGPAFRQQVEKETFLLINQYRKENDFPPLVWDEEIARTARAHSKDMATGGDFGHDGFSDRIGHLRQIMPGIWGSGENVLYTSELNDVARRALQLWLHSPHHLKNIRGDYNHSGLGVWQDKDGTLYFTQIFVKIKPPAQETQATPPPAESQLTGLFANPETRPNR